MAESRELSIGEMLADPIVCVLMTADGVDRGELEALLRSIAKLRRAAHIESLEDQFSLLPPAFDGG